MVVHLLGKQNIAFRGHRDSAPLSPDCTSKRNEGNFKAIFNLLLARGDCKIAT